MAGDVCIEAGLVDEALQKWIFIFASARESSFVSERMYRGHRYIEQC